MINILNPFYFYPIEILLKNKKIMQDLKFAFLYFKDIFL